MEVSDDFVERVIAMHDKGREMNEELRKKSIKSKHLKPFSEELLEEINKEDDK